MPGARHPHWQQGGIFRSGRPHVTIEDRTAVEIALRHYTDGRNALDFADALHHAAYRNCQRTATFDDRKFARRAARLQLRPKVEAPA